MSDDTPGLPEELQKIHGIMKGVRTTMLVTHDADGALHSHPMTTQDADFTGECWFIAGAESDTVTQIKADGRVNLAYSGTSSWLSLSGTATIVDDVAKKKELWNTFADVWFDGGPEDPKAVLIHIDAESAQYWDTPGRLATMVSMLKAKVTGDRPGAGESEEVQLG